MVKKLLFISLALFGLLFSQMAEECFADASGQGIIAVTPVKNPLACWKFEGNASDSTGSNDGIENGNLTYEAGAFGQAINFDGKDDYVLVPDNGGSATIEFGDESFSITLWVKSKWAVGSHKEFIVKNGTSGSEYTGASGKRYVIKFQTQNFRFVLDDGVTKTMLNGSSADFATGTWVHAAVVRDTTAEELLLYCNGLLVSTAVNNSGDISSPGEDLFIGASPQENAGASGPDTVPTGYFFSGMLDDVRIYDYALSQAEIVSVMGASALRVPLLSSDALFDIARRYERSRKYGEARSIYQQLVQQYPDSSEAGKARLYIPKMNVLSLFDSKEKTAAEAALDSLIADFNDHPDLPEDLYGVAKRYQDSGKYERAKIIYEKITTHCPGPEYPLKAQRNLVILYISMEETDQAQEALDKLAQEFSGDRNLPKALLSIAETYRKSKKFEEAESIYETVATDYPGTEHALKARKKLTIVYVDVGDDTGAQEALDKLAQEFSGNPNLADALYEIATRYEWVRGRYEEAQPIYQQIIQQFPDSSYAKEQVDLSRTNVIYLIESGNYSLAQEVLHKLVAEFSGHPDLPRTLDGIAGRYEKAKKYDEAKSIYQDIVANYPGTDYAFDAQRKIAIVDIKAGNDTAAQAALDRLIADFNDHPALPEAVVEIGEQYYHKAFTYKNESLDTEARDHFRKAIAVWERIITELPASATTPQAYYFSARCYRRLGEYNNAIKCYQKVVDDWPEYKYAWDAQYMIGRTYQYLKRSDAMPESKADPKIKAAYERVLQDYPDCPAAKAAQNWLKYNVKLSEGGQK